MSYVYSTLELNNLLLSYYMVTHLLALLKEIVVANHHQNSWDLLYRIGDDWTFDLEEYDTF